MMRRTSDRKPPRRKRAAVVIQTSGASPALAAKIRKTARAAFQFEGRTSGNLEVAVVEDAGMRRLHRLWMGLGNTTDVLTFDLSDEPRSRDVDAQLVVCKSVAKRCAAKSRSPWQSELLLYVVHGCLHLCGYDDVTAAKAARMHRREDAILRRLGYGAVYSGERQAPPGKKKTARKRRKR